MLGKSTEFNTGRKSFCFDNKISFADLKTKTVDGKRHYITEDNQFSYPSVTTILDYNSDKTFLKNWRKNIGEENADRISRVAAKRGTSFHALCEKYILCQPMDFSLYMPNEILMFNSIKKILDVDIDDIHCIEEVLISHKLKIAGRVDLIAKYKNQLSVIDFKTSAKPKKIEWIEDYFKQATMYAYMFYEMTGIIIKKIAILIAVDSTGSAQVFVESPSNFTEKVSSNIKNFYKNP